jgi:DNA-binding transcriptional ArsR family regulator
MGNQPRIKIVVPTTRQRRREVNNRQSNKPAWMTGAFFDAAILIGATLATTLLLLLISGQLHDTTAGTLIARSAAPLLEPLGLSQPTVSHHLKVLSEAGLVIREQRGRWAYYRLSVDRLAFIRRALSP